MTEQNVDGKDHSALSGWREVSIPVKIYPATERKDVRFHLYDRRTGQRVRYERVTRTTEPPSFVPPPVEDEVADADEWRPAVEDAPRPVALPESAAAERRVESSDIVRGVELPSGDFVTVTDEELEPLAPERSRVIEIEEFVDIGEIDPVFFDRSYYVAPAWKGRRGARDLARLDSPGMLPVPRTRRSALEALSVSVPFSLKSQELPGTSAS